MKLNTMIFSAKFYTPPRFLIKNRSLSLEIGLKVQKSPTTLGYPATIFEFQKIVFSL